MLWQSLPIFPEPAVTTSAGSSLLTSGCCFLVGLRGEQGPACLWQPLRGAARLARAARDGPQRKDHLFSVGVNSHIYGFAKLEITITYSALHSPVPS